MSHPAARNGAASSGESTPLTQNNGGGAAASSRVQYTSLSVNDPGSSNGSRVPGQEKPSGDTTSTLWQFKGWGEYYRREEVAPETLEAIQQELERKHAAHPMLGQWPATSICSNDILSSCFYTIGLVTSYSGKMAPLCLLLVGLALYFFRGIYGEAITSYPMNGGSYNLLINTTSKSVAALGACLSIIAYIATGVVSAVTACDYLNGVWPAVNVVETSCGLLLFFAFVVLMGITESATVAFVICATHVVTLLGIIALGLVYAIAHGFEDFRANLQIPVPDVYAGANVIPGGFATALLFGFAGGMLGVSGFETSAQFVESQKPGVFLQTLRNMWIGVTFFNPLLSFLSLSVLPVDDVIFYSSTVIARVARVVGDWLDNLFFPGHKALGPYLATWVSIDAFIVLSGAVLTAYVGIDGLLYQLSSDGCLPAVLMNKNQWRQTNHYIILVYLFLATSQVVLLKGDVDALAGVYSFAFLGVMIIFCLGTMLLKLKRASLPRDVVAPWWHVICALILVIVAFFANLKSKPQYLVYFSVYFLMVGFVILVMFERVQLLKLLLYFGPPSLVSRLKRHLQEDVRKDEVVFFCKKPDLYVLNKAMLYVRHNEATCAQLTVVHCYDDEQQISPEFTSAVQMLDKMYPSIKVNFLRVRAPFGPAVVEYLSKLIKLPKNMMFITCPDSQLRVRIDKLGGLRVITH